MEFIKKNWSKVLIAVLIFSNLFVWFLVYQRESERLLTVQFFDVGQGDAIFIESPSRGRILIDGGRNRQVLSELGNVLPFFDRRLDVVFATHPDSDHIGGLPEVISRYDVELFISSEASGEGSTADTLAERLQNKSVPTLVAERGMTIDFGDGVKLVVLFPNQDVSWWPTNDGSVVSKLTYGDHSFLLTGDATARTEGILLSLGSKILDTDVLQVGHHGSRTSTSRLFAEAVSPIYAVISAGRDNSYGHPHSEVLENLSKVGAIILGTFEYGAVKFKTDGEILRVE